MNVTIEPGFIERTVFTAVRRHTALLRQYQDQCAACYRPGDSTAQERAFTALHDRWFADLGLRALIVDTLHEFPRIGSDVAQVVVTAAHGIRQQSADLYGESPRQAVAMRVFVETLLCADTFRAWARHEIQHVEVILEPAFGYTPLLRPAGATGATENLIRERYGLLWAISIDSRLARKRKHSAFESQVKTQRLRELARAFGIIDAETAAAHFERLWRSARECCPTHAELLQMAGEGLPSAAPSRLEAPAPTPPFAPEAEPAGTASDDPVAQTILLHPRPGDACPLCRFPAYDWQLDLPPTILDAVRGDFPHWHPQAGVCGRCAELYHSRVRSSPLVATRRPIGMAVPCNPATAQ